MRGYADQAASAPLRPSFELEQSEEQLPEGRLLRPINLGVTNRLCPLNPPQSRCPLSAWPSGHFPWKSKSMCGSGLASDRHFLTALGAGLGRACVGSWAGDSTEAGPVWVG